VEELEREVSVWKLALKTSHEEVEQYKKNISKLERNIGSLKVSGTRAHTRTVCYSLSVLVHR
jgi:hypothetical protein